MNKKRVLLQINTVINYASTGRIAEEIGKTAIDNGWESYIAYGRFDRPSKSNKIRIGTKFDVLYHVFKTRLFDKHGLASKKATLKFIKEIEQIKPSIIHLHDIHGYYLNYELLFKYLSSIDTPVVWTLHSCWPITGHCTYFSYVKCDKWKTHCNNCPQKKKYPASYLKDNSYKNFMLKQKSFTSVDNITLVPVSYWLGNVVSSSFLKKLKKHVIHNGINIDAFKPIETCTLRTKLNLKDKFILLGVANVWTERKGLEDYMLLSKYLKPDEVIILLGLTEKQIKKLPSNIKGLSRTENIKELAELYSLADIVLNLSVEETFGLTTIEGFACGTPGVVYNTTASPELITPDTGEVVCPHDTKQIRFAIDKIKSKGKEYYTDNCRRRAIQFFNKENNYKEYFLLYESILSSK